MTPSKKNRLAERDALISLGAVAAIVVFWSVAGFGVDAVFPNATIFGVPLWAIMGTVGTWIFASALAVWLWRRVYVDFSLMNDEQDEPPAGETSPATEK